MIKKILFLSLLLSAATISQAQSVKADTFYLSVYNTGARIEITPADFGGKVTQDLMGTMVRAFDTVMVLKANGQPTAQATNASATKQNAAPIEYQKI